MQKSLIIAIVAIIAVVGIAAGIYFFAPQIFKPQPTTNNTNTNLKSNLTYTGLYDELKDIKIPKTGALYITSKGNSTFKNYSGEVTINLTIYYDNTTKAYYGKMEISSKKYYGNYNMTIEVVGKDNVSIFCYPVLGKIYCHKTEVNTTKNRGSFNINKTLLTEEIKELLNKIPFKKTTKDGKEIYTVKINNELIKTLLKEVSNIKSLKELSAFALLEEYIKNKILKGLNQIEINGKLTITVSKDYLNTITIVLQMTNTTNPSEKVSFTLNAKFNQMSQEEVLSIVNNKFENLSSMATELNLTTTSQMV